MNGLFLLFAHFQPFLSELLKGSFMLMHQALCKDWPLCLDWFFIHSDILTLFHSRSPPTLYVETDWVLSMPPYLQSIRVLYGFVVVWLCFMILMVIYLDKREEE